MSNPLLSVFPRFAEGFSHLPLTLESALRQIALPNECQKPFPANKRSDNSQSGMISENDRITS
jgi:hypothetical protein